MVTAGLAGIVAGLIDPESIYFKKLSRRAESVARAHDMHRLEHIMVRNVMLRHFPTVKNTDTAVEIIRAARANAHIESLPVMDENAKLVGIIRPADLHRVLDSDVPPQLINADDIAMRAPFALSTNANILEALRDFGASDIESLPVEQDGRIVGLLLRSDVMRRYREEMLRRH
jgi:CIC family chloride channel protein